MATLTIAAVSDDSEVKQLRQEVAYLTELVTSLSTHTGHPSRNHSRSKSRHFDSSAPQLPPKDPLCWYHSTFEKKRDSQALVVTGVSGQKSSGLFYMNSHAYFLVDTGSGVSAIPLSFTERKRPADKLTLMAVNDTAPKGKDPSHST